MHDAVFSFINVLVDYRFFWQIFSATLSLLTNVTNTALIDEYVFIPVFISVFKQLYTISLLASGRTAYVLLFVTGCCLV